MKKLRIIVVLVSLLLLGACTDVDMNPYPNGGGPNRAPTWGTSGPRPDFDRVDRGIYRQ